MLPPTPRRPCMTESANVAGAHGWIHARSFCAKGRAVTVGEHAAQFQGSPDEALGFDPRCRSCFDHSVLRETDAKGTRMSGFRFLIFPCPLSYAFATRMPRCANWLSNPSTSDSSSSAER